MDVTVLMPDGKVIEVAIKTFDTAKDLLLQLTDKYDAEERKRYRLFELKRMGDVPIQRALDATTNISALKKDWTADRSLNGMLKLIRVNEAVVVNFNIYFRMTAGKSETRATFYVTEDVTVSQLNNEIKAYLNLPKTENRFGLMGNYNAKQELRKLSGDEKVVKLRVAWENDSNTFFQFQVLPEAENSLRLGADKEGFLEIKGLGGMMWSRRWFSLRGSSLFYFKEKGDIEPVGEIDQVFSRKIIEIGQEKKALLSIGQKATWRFDIEKDGKVQQLAADDEATLKSWIEVIKSSASRQVSRDTSLGIPSQTKRTLIPIGDNPEETAAKLAAVSKVAEKKKEEQSLDELLQSIKTKGNDLLGSRSKEAVEKTKILISGAQEFVVKTTSLVGERTTAHKKQNVLANAAQVKDKLKEIISAAKGVATQTNVNEITPEVKKLRSLLGELYNMCEFLILAVQQEEEEDLGIVPVAPEPAKKPATALKTGNDQLDSAVTGLSMFGVAPELMELMRQAAAMPQEEEQVPTIGITQPDNQLDDILANLSGAMAGLDVTPSYAPSSYAPVPAATLMPKPVAAPRPLSIGLDSCASCYGTIEGTVIKAFNQTYHPNCFYCSQCGRNFSATDLDKKNVFESMKGLLCRNDWLNTLEKCPTCKLPVEPQDALVAFNKVYHKKCFKCSDCSNIITLPGFLDSNQILCELCYHKRQGTICDFCYKPIYGKSLTVVDKKRHPECFVCTHCKKTLTKETAKLRNQKLYCDKHALELFG